jgi:hypothetical protein
MVSNTENDYLNNVNPKIYQNNQIPNNNQNNNKPVQQINTNQQPIVNQQAAPPQFGGIQYNFVEDPLIELANSVGAVIYQQINMMEIISGYKLPNTYHVLVQDSNGQYKYLFKGNEKKGKIDECQCYCCFFFKIFIKHIKNQEMFNQNFENYFATIEKPYICTCCCCGRPYMECNYGDGTKIGKVIEAYTCCDPKFCIYDENNKIKYSINCDCCQSSFCCRHSNLEGRFSECLFEICEENGNVDGYIKRLPSQGLQMFSNSDSYYIKFPNNASPLDKLLIIFTTILIDYQYFEAGPGEQQYAGIDINRKRRY